MFLVTHDLDTLYTICDRVAVLSQKKVLVVDTLERVAATDDAWVREYFHGPRGRAAHKPPPCRRITEMETRAHHVLIGLFSVIVIGAALLFGLWLAKSGSEGKFNYYDIVFNEAVSGLSQGSSVQYSGIKVGDVAFLRLDPQDPRKVWARIRVVASAPIKQDTTAKLALTGITGTSIIQLSSGTPASPMLEGKDGKIPVIVATPSPLTQLLSNGEDLMGNINQLIARFSNLLSEENTARISRTLDHLDQATGALSAERENVSAVMQQLAQASRQANAALAQASELMRSANGLLNEQGKGMMENANKTMASLERTSATLDQLISENRHSLDGGIQGLAELGPAVSELRDTLAALRGISRRLEENPANYLLGREKPRSSPHEARPSPAASPVPGRRPGRARHPRRLLDPAGSAGPPGLPATGAQPSGQRRRAVDWSLRIARPRTSLVLESPRIAVRPHGDEISVYQGARWSDPAPSLLRDRLMQAFQADGRVRGLSSDDSNLQADFELGGDLRAFQTEYPNGQASALIRYDARLVRTDDKRVVASRRFEVSQPVDGKKVAAVVSAFGKAGDTLSAQVLDWTLRQASAQPAVQP